jgi:hypothetical protein
MFGFPCFYVKNYTHVVSIDLNMCLHDNASNISNKKCGTISHQYNEYRIVKTIYKTL